MDLSTVESKGPPKSIVSGMSLNPISEISSVEKIFISLATDLVERLRLDFYQNKRFASNLVVGIRISGFSTQKKLYNYVA